MNLRMRFKNENLFEYINSIEKLPFNYTSANNYWLNKYGDKNIIPSFESMDINIIADMLYHVYYSKWCLLFSNYTKDLLKEGNKLETTERVINDTSNSTTTTDGTNTHNVSAFDSVDMVNDKSDVENKTTSDSLNANKTETITVKSKSGNYINDFINYNNYLTKTNFFDMLCIDINNSLTYGVISIDIEE